MRTKRQLHVRVRPADGRLTARWGDAILPGDNRTGRVRRDQLDRVVDERIAVHIRNVVPDVVVVVESVSKVRLRAAVKQTARRAGDLDADASCYVILTVLFGVVLAGFERLSRPDGGSHRPDVDGVGAVVVDDGMTNSMHQR